jgi:hypothetical protein
MLKGINLDPEGNNSLGLLKGLSLDLGTANETSNLSDRPCSSFISVLVFVVEVQNEVMEGGRWFVLFRWRVGFGSASNRKCRIRIRIKSEKTNPDLDPHQGDADPLSLFEAVLRIWVRMFLGFLDPDQDPLIRGMDPDPSIKQNGKKNVDSVLWLLFDFLSLKSDVNVPSKSNKQKNFFFKLVFCWRLGG